MAPPPGWYQNVPYEATPFLESVKRMERISFHDLSKPLGLICPQGVDRAGAELAPCPIPQSLYVRRDVDAAPTRSRAPPQGIVSNWTTALSHPGLSWGPPPRELRARGGRRACRAARGGHDGAVDPVENE